MDVLTAQARPKSKEDGSCKKKKKKIIKELMNDRMNSTMTANYQLFGFMLDYPMRTRVVNVSSMKSKLSDIANIVHHIGARNMMSVTMCGICTAPNHVIEACPIWENEYLG